MRAYLVRAVKWLLVKLAPEMELIIAEPAVMGRVREVVKWAEEALHVVNGKIISGERKRSQVLNKLIVEYPNIPIRDLAFLIERVLQEKK